LTPRRRKKGQMEAPTLLKLLLQKPKRANALYYSAIKRERAAGSCLPFRRKKGRAALAKEETTCLAVSQKRRSRKCPPRNAGGKKTISVVFKEKKAD